MPNLQVPHHVLRLSRTEAPSLPRHYPASSVLRASPQPLTAQPGSHELLVSTKRQYHCWGFPCSVCLPMHACRRQYPGRSDGSCSLIPLHQRRPSPRNGRVGSCVMCFEACSTFTHIATYMLTESLKRLFAPKAPTVSLPLPPLRLLPGGTNQFPGGVISH